MQIVKAGADSIEDLVRLNGVVQDLHAEREPACFRPFDPAAVREQVRDALHDPAVTFLVAVEDGNAQGYVMLRVCERAENPYRKPMKYVELDQIAVAPESRGRGVGSALIDAAFARAKSQDIGDVELSVWEFNEAAQRLFAKKGFGTSVRRMRSEIA